MKAVRYHEYGDASVLRYEDADRPKPSAGEVLIQVAATSFNPVDGAIRAGYLQQVFPIRFPHTPGIDVAGTVAAVGPGVSGFSVGDPVIGFLPMNGNGAAAEFVLAPAGVLTAAPTSLPLTEAAALPAAALTAWQALCRRLRRAIRQTGRGGRLATASARSTATVRSNGADQIIDDTSTTLSAAITESLDVVLSLVMASEPDMAALVNTVRPGGATSRAGQRPAPSPWTTGWLRRTLSRSARRRCCGLQRVDRRGRTSGSDCCGRRILRRRPVSCHPRRAQGSRAAAAVVRDDFLPLG